MSKTKEKLFSIENSLSDSGYLISHDVKLPNDDIAQIVASRTYLSWKGLVIKSQHILISTINNPTIANIKTLYQFGFCFGKERNRVPLLRGVQFGYMIIPVILANEVSKELKNYINSPPKKRWGIMEFPVVWDAISNNINFYE